MRLFLNGLILFSLAYLGSQAQASWVVPSELSFEGILYNNSGSTPVAYDFSQISGGTGVYFQLIEVPASGAYAGDYCVLYQEGYADSFTTGDVVFTLGANGTTYVSVNPNNLISDLYSTSVLSGYLTSSSTAGIVSTSASTTCSVPAGDTGTRILRVLVSNAALTSAPATTTSITVSADLPLNPQPYAFMAENAHGLNGTTASLSQLTDAQVYTLSNIIGSGITGLNSSSPSATAGQFLMANGTGSTVLGSLTAGSGIGVTASSTGWQISLATDSSAFAISNATSSSSTTTGAFTVSGGAGIGGSVNAGGNLSAVGKLSSGVEGADAGQLVLNSSTSGGSFTINPPSVGSGLIWNLPSSNGSANNFLSTDGAGNLSWSGSYVSVGATNNFTAKNTITGTGGLAVTGTAGLQVGTSGGAGQAGLQVGSSGTVITQMQACQLAVSSGSTTQTVTCTGVNSSSICVCNSTGGGYVQNASPGSGNISVTLSASCNSNTINCQCMN